MLKHTVLVYGVYVNIEADWRKLILLQLNDLHRSGIFSVADLHVIVTNPSGGGEVADFFKSLPIPIAHIEFHDENQFEYPAIAYVWNLANREASPQYIAYLHTKGMSHAKHRRNGLERALTHFTFARWAHVLQVFQNEPSVEKIGLFPAGQRDAPGGWIWFNFWWARSSLIRRLPRPEQTTYRYYYESWLGSPPSTGSYSEANCYSIFSEDRSLFAQSEADEGARLIRRQLKYGPLYPVRTILENWKYAVRRLFRSRKPGPQ